MIPEKATYDQKYGPAMAIKDPDEAKVYFKELVNHAIKTGIAQGEAEKIEKGNLAYWAGYYSEETRERVEKLFVCEHPVFGSISKNGPINAIDAFNLVQKVGSAISRGEDVQSAITTAKKEK